jgi:four helix bundle protein
MDRAKSTKQYDLEDRTFEFAAAVRKFIPSLPRTLSNGEDVKQLVRSSGSVAANYIEANESLSKKDFVLRIKICRKESKESRLWLRLLNTGTNTQTDQQRLALMQESSELICIFTAILTKTQGAI